MKLFISIICLLMSAQLAGAQTSPPKPAETFGQLSRSASEELDKSTKELAKLREEINAEKVPLGKKLKELEERLSELRTRQEQTSRRADTSNLDTANIKASTKVRQDDLNYVSGLLDEYAKSFETKINPTEMQYAAKEIEAAKNATANNALSQAEKFAAQLAFVRFSTKRTFDLIGGMRFDGEAIDSQSIVAKGQFAILGPIVLFSNSTGSVAGLVLPQAGGSAKPLVRPLEPPLQAGLVKLVATGEGTVPLDPSLGAALKALVQKTSLLHIFEKGGIIMWPLLIASIAALGVVVERTIFLILVRLRRNTKEMDDFFKAISEGRMDKATSIGVNSKFYVVRTMGYALKHKEQSLASALIFAEGLELKKFRRGIPILDTVITLAPLLGLLGTVTGMMGSFSIIGGDLGAPGAITGGIAEALIATAFGLLIAITSLIPYNILNTKLEEARLEIEAAASQLELLVHPGAHKTSEVADAHLVAVEKETSHLKPAMATVGAASSGKE
jgi:biopolymer transport protein ExbB